MMDRQFTNQEDEEWLANLPKKRIGVKAIIKSNKGDILIVKPNYKKNWQLPGGSVEEYEDPKDGLVRELAEELQLSVGRDDLELIDTIFRKNHDNLVLIYEYIKKVQEDKKLVVQKGELEGYKFTDLNAVASLVGEHAYYDELWKHYGNA